MRKNNIEEQYLDLLKEVLASGTRKDDRTGTGTISLFGKQIRHDMSLGFPAITTKKLAFKTMATELTWFLRGDTSIKYLVDRNCHVWDGDAYKAFCDSHTTAGNPNGKALAEQLNSVVPIGHSLKSFIEEIKNNNEFAKKWANLGKIYGHSWRNWNGQLGNNEGIDQIKDVVLGLKSNPDSRRLLVSAWNPTDVKDDNTVLPPCHYGFQLYTRKLNQKERYDIWFKQNYETGLEYNPDNTPDYDYEMYEPTPTRAISLMWNQRSADLALGIPFNIASYALLLEVVAKEVGMIPDELIGTIGDAHIYSDHVDGVKTQLQREPLELPRLEINDNVKWKTGDVLPYYQTSDFKLVGYQSHPKIKFPLSN